MKQAVCILVPRGDLFLGVSRKDNHELFGLPGGKVESLDFSIASAAKRELWEETGIMSMGQPPYDLTYLFDAPCGRFQSTCYLYVGATENLDPTSSEEGIISWCTREQLISGPFGEYNKRAFEEYDRYVQSR